MTNINSKCLTTIHTQNRPNTSYTQHWLLARIKAQGWGENAPLPPMWPGFDCGPVSHCMWIGFVFVLALLQARIFLQVLLFLHP